MTSLRRIQPPVSTAFVAEVRYNNHKNAAATGRSGAAVFIFFPSLIAGIASLICNARLHWPRVTWLFESGWNRR